jgi:hypothetical protein
MSKKLLENFRNDDYIAPLGSICVGPEKNGIPYMFVWKEAETIRLEFRTVPKVPVIFHHSVCPELIAALIKLQNEK